MKKELLSELMGMLEKEKTSIEKELESFATEDKNIKGNWDAKRIASEDTDMDEKAGEAQEYDNLISLEHNLELRLKDITAALEKMSRNAYGKCEKCGKDIEEERLLAYPEARACIKCN